MKKKLLVLIFFGFLVIAPNLVLAECGNIGFFNRFSLEGPNTVMLYLGSKAVARFDLQTCSVRPDSIIELLKNYVCDGDEIVIDGFKCTIMEVKPFGP